MTSSNQMLEKPNFDISANTSPSYLEAEDDGPDEAEREARVPVHDVVRTHVFQMHPLLVEEHQRLVHVLQAVNSHLALGRPRLQKYIHSWRVTVRHIRVLEYWPTRPPVGTIFRGRWRGRQHLKFVIGICCFCFCHSFCETKEGCVKQTRYLFGQETSRQCTATHVSVAIALNSLNMAPPSKHSTPTDFTVYFVGATQCVHVRVCASVAFIRTIFSHVL